MTSSSTALPADPSVLKVPGGRAKTEEAVKSLAAIIKLYDTVLQSMGQLRSLAIVEEKEGVRLANEGLEAYFHAIRSVERLVYSDRVQADMPDATILLACTVFTLHRRSHPRYSCSNDVIDLSRKLEHHYSTRTSHSRKRSFLCRNHPSLNSRIVSSRSTSLPNKPCLPNGSLNRSSLTTRSIILISPWKILWSRLAELPRRSRQRKLRQQRRRPWRAWQRRWFSR